MSSKFTITMCTFLVAKKAFDVHGVLEKFNGYHNGLFTYYELKSDLIKKSYILSIFVRKYPSFFFSISFHQPFHYGPSSTTDFISLPSSPMLRCRATS